MFTRAHTAVVCVAALCACAPGGAEYTLDDASVSDAPGASTPAVTIEPAAATPACAAGQYCVRGVCGTMPPLYHGWTSPIAGCVTTGFNATAATNQGGMYPYNMGDSLACRAWKLAATVCTTMLSSFT